MEIYNSLQKKKKQFIIAKSLCVRIKPHPGHIPIKILSVSAINLSLFISGSRIFYNSVLAFQTNRFEEKYPIKSLILALDSIK